MATAATKSPSKVIDQRQHAADTYRLIDNNEEFYERTGEQIVRACKMQISVQVWADNFRATLNTIYHWADGQPGKIEKILCEPRSDKVIFFVVPTSDEFDFDLGFAQATLDVTLNTQCNIGYAETRQVPRWDLKTFVSPEAMMIWSAPGTSASGR